MFKMVIADDEHLVREGLRTVVAWEDYGIEIVGKLPMVRKPLNYARAYPDILLQISVCH